MPSPPPAHAEREPHRQVDLRPATSVALAGVALTVAALTFDAAPLFVPGLAFLLLSVLAPAWMALAARAAHVRRRLADDRVVEDEPLEMVVEIERGPLGLPGAELRDPLAGAPIPVGEAMAPLFGRRRLALRVVARIHRRGRHTFAAPQLTMTDAFGLVRLQRRGDGPAAEILVLPRVEPLQWLDGEQRHAAGGEAAHAAPEPTGASEIDGLRAYRPGSPASRIHWAALARGVGLHERRLVAEPRAQPLIVLDPRIDADPAAEERLDDAVRATASLTVALARRGGCNLLLPGDHLPVAVERSLNGWAALHTRLALVEPERDPRCGPRLRPDAVTGALVYVTATAEMPTAWLGRGVRRGRLIVVRPLSLGDPLEGPPTFEVGGCAGYLVRARTTERRRAA